MLQQTVKSWPPTFTSLHIFFKSAKYKEKKILKRSVALQSQWITIHNFLHRSRCCLRNAHTPPRRKAQSYCLTSRNKILIKNILFFLNVTWNNVIIPTDMNSNTSELPQVQPSTRQNCPVQRGNPNRDKGQKTHKPCNQTRQSREIKQVKPLHCPSHKQQFCPLLLCIHTSGEKRRRKRWQGECGGGGKARGKHNLVLKTGPVDNACMRSLELAPLIP